MPIIQDTPSMAPCPKCGGIGPYNFRLEQRASFKRPDPNYPNVLNKISSIEVWACVRCGHVLTEA